MPETANKVVLGAALVVLVMIGASCAHHKAVVAPEPQAGSAAQQSAPQPPESGTTTVKPEPQISAAENPEGGVKTGELPTSVEEINKAGYLKDAFFDTDKADLRSDARDLLSGDAAWLKEHPTVKLLVEGHCDERNTEEYNLALGWRRANAVKAYLAELGVGADRISTISYGEERPFATCHNESCWWQNRRAHFVVTAR